VWSEEGGSRLILKLGEAGMLHILISRQVMSEVEGVINRKSLDLLPLLGMLIDQSRSHLVPSAPANEIEKLYRIVGHAGDAHVAADAMHAKAEFLVTLDKAHLLGNTKLQHHVSCRIVSPGDFLAWFRQQI